MTPPDQSQAAKTPLGMKIFLWGFFLIFVVAPIAYVVYGACTESGLFGWFARLEARLLGRYHPVLAGLLTLVTLLAAELGCLFLPVWLIGLLAGQFKRKQEPPTS